MSMVLPALFLFMFGFTVGALLSWWVTWYWECPKKHQARTEGENQEFDMALRASEQGMFEVYFEGRWHQEARTLVPSAFQQLQQMSFRLLRWLDEAERLRYASREDLRPKRSPLPASASATPTGLERMHEEIDQLVQRKAREMGITVPVRIASAGHTVVIWVGDEKFERLADIPDEQVQRLIRAAVQEWERQWRLRQAVGNDLAPGA